MNTSSTSTAAKGLVGAIAIASGTAAYGSVVGVATPADLTNVPGGGTQIPGAQTGITGTFTTWDVNGDGVGDFLFSNRYPNTASGSLGVVWQLNMNPATAALAATNGVIGYNGAFIRYASPVAFGSSIGQAAPFRPRTRPPSARATATAPKAS